MNAQPDLVSKKAFWGGWTLSGLPAAFLLMGAGMNLSKQPKAVEGAMQLGYPESAILPMGAALLVSTLLYLIPRTSVLGAILLTGYLGGAVATHVRISDPLLSKTLLPVYFGILLWGGLFLREKRLRALIPFRR